MIIDNQEVFADAQAVTSTGDTASTNVIDTGSAYDDGTGEHVYLVAQVDTTATSGGAATLAAVISDSADNSTFADVLVGPATPVASLTAGRQLLRTRLPIGLRRYVRVTWRVGTAALTAGKFDAFLTKDAQSLQYPASGYTVA